MNYDDGLDDTDDMQTNTLGIDFGHHQAYSSRIAAGSSNTQYSYIHPNLEDRTTLIL